MPRDRRYKRSSILKMDPDCAICHLPANADCGCEAKGLETAIKLAEQRIMQNMYMEIRTWVRQHAQDYVLAYFGQLSERRRTAHRKHINDITTYAFHHYNAPPHPTDIDAADAQLKKGIDEDWQRSVQRYPEVLEYFFSLVEVTLPTENDPSVKDLPLTTLSIPRKVARRSHSRPPPTIASGSVHNGGAPQPPGAPRITRGRTPPAIEARRTPGPPEPPRYHRGLPPPGPGSAYNAGHYPYQS